MRSHIDTLRQGFFEPALLLSNFNRSLDMYDRLAIFPEDIQDRLKSILHESSVFFIQSMHELLLVYTKKQNENSQVLIDGLVRDSAKILSTAAGIAVSIHGNMEIPETLLDIDSLTKVLENVLDNGTKVCLNEIRKHYKKANFVSIVEQVIDKIQRHRILIGKSILIDETIIDYKKFIEEEKEKQETNKKRLQMLLGGGSILGGVVALYFGKKK